jgi:hypothetical protein
MDKISRIIEVRTGEGKLIFTLQFVERDLDGGGKTGQAAGGNSDPMKGKGPAGSPKDGNSLMTDAQKRFLFRILADKGMEGESAYAHLKSVLAVDSLKDASKQEASRLISRLLEEGQGGSYDGPPFQ